MMKQIKKKKNKNNKGGNMLPPFILYIENK